MKINDEVKVRRSIRADILGEAKVMGFNELEEARAKPAEKDAAKADKGKVKRGRKRKGAAKGEEPHAKVARHSEGYVENQVASSSSWRAPEAPMTHNRIV